MNNFLIESTTPIIFDYYKDFISFVCDELDIDHNIPVSFISKTGNASFGNYNPSTRHIQVALDGRHTADVLRTLAHELVHEAQHSNGIPDVPLDQLEYEANALAGMLMREYNRLHPELYDGEDEVDPEELDDTGGVGAAQGSLENAGITVDAFQTPSYEHEGLADAQPMRPAYPVELAEEAIVNTAGSGEVAGIGVGPDGEPGVHPQKKITPMFKRKTLKQLREDISISSSFSGDDVKLHIPKKRKYQPTSFGMTQKEKSEKAAIEQDTIDRAGYYGTHRHPNERHNLYFPPKSVRKKK